jgi:hypothetical protein
MTLLCGLARTGEEENEQQVGYIMEDIANVLP